MTVRAVRGGRIRDVPEGPAWTPELLQSPHEAADKAPRVRRMFNAIAPRYELVNTLFSAGRDAYWRRRAVELAEVRADDDVLDIATGTGDLARAFAKAGPRRVVGCDFAHEMLLRAAGFSPRGVYAHTEARCSGWIEADALGLPFADGSFSIASCAFGVRNFADLDSGLAEMFRVLRPGGRAVILEFTRPTNALVRCLYELYSNRLMPIAASWVSGDRSGAYRYLPRSVVSFLSADQMCAKLHAAGFVPATATPLSLGVVTVYVATRS
jgi:demethylmenaquinone methyltransferase/2-methoxy-6-polyprenyl-1,4-benzoquinol methylase